MVRRAQRSEPGGVRELAEVLLELGEAGDVERLLEDLLTPQEMEAIGERWAIVKLLAAGKTQREVRDALGVSVTTVTRGNKQLQHGTGGFQRALAALARKPRSRP
jgi:Trp operon repressor